MIGLTGLFAACRSFSGMPLAERTMVVHRFQPDWTQSTLVISSPTNSNHAFWKSRNVPMAQIDIPDIGKATIFSVHTGWWDDDQEPFQSQFERLTAWAGEFSSPGSTTLFCGDFNLTAGSKMQQFMTNGSGYSDQYALANPDGLVDATVSNTGGRALRGLRFELQPDGTYRLVTRLGAAVSDPGKGLRPHNFLITDRSGVRVSLGIDV